MEKQKEKIKSIFGKLINRETILYGVFGVLTSAVNVLLFKLLLVMGLDYRIGNIITLVVVKLLAYICNKNFVFKSKCPNFYELVKEFVRFLITRGATALIDYFGLILMVEVMHLQKMPCKVFVTLFVIVINYIVGKKHVFKGSKNGEKEGTEE